jgi:hypothetical protein
MQNYQPNPLEPEFFALALVALLFAACWLIEKAFYPQIFAARQRAAFRQLSEREQYFRDLQAGTVGERQKGDLWRSSYTDEIEFEDFLTSIWRESEFWYPRRRAAFHLFEREKRFIVHRANQSSPTEVEMDAIEYII